MIKDFIEEREMVKMYVKNKIKLWVFIMFKYDYKYKIFKYDFFIYGWKRFLKI